MTRQPKRHTSVYNRVVVILSYEEWIPRGRSQSCVYGTVNTCKELLPSCQEVCGNSCGTRRNQQKEDNNQICLSFRSPKAKHQPKSKRSRTNTEARYQSLEHREEGPHTCLSTNESTTPNDQQQIPTVNTRWYKQYLYIEAWCKQ